MHKTTSTTNLSFYPSSALPTGIVGKGREQGAVALQKQLHSLIRIKALRQLSNLFHAHS